MCPRGQGRPRGLHLCSACFAVLALKSLSLDLTSLGAKASQQAKLRCGRWKLSQNLR